MKILVAFLILLLCLLIYGLGISTNSRRTSRIGKERRIFAVNNNDDDFSYKNYEKAKQRNRNLFNEKGQDNHRENFLSNSKSRVVRETTAESQEWAADYDGAKKVKLENANRKKSISEKTADDKDKGQDELQFPEDYSIYEIPKDPSGSPLPVFIHVNVRTILEFDELKEFIKLDLELEVMWMDFKIFYYNNHSIDSTTFQYNVPYIDNLTDEEVKQKLKVLNNPLILEKIWKPNLFIEDLLAVEQPAVMARPQTTKFIPEIGWFQFTTRITVKLDCEMIFHYYPADTQFCDFSIRGFSYNKEKLSLNWYRNGAYLYDLELPGFDVHIDRVIEYDWEKNSNAEVFEVLSFTIAARRRLSYHLVQTYLASTFYIIITCLCFLLPSKMVEVRVGITMTALLTLTAMFASVRESTPIASYVKAIDIWMVGCIFFVFLTLAQFIFHVWLRNTKNEYVEKQTRKTELQRDHDNHDRSTESSEIELKKPSYSNDNTCSQAIVDKKMTKKFQLYDKMANLIDRYSFAMFLCIFACGSAIYWTWLLQASDYYNWYVNETLNYLEGYE